MRPLFSVAVAVVLGSFSLSAKSDNDPKVADRTKSEWLDILRTETNARRRKTAVQVLGQIAVNYPDTTREILDALGKAVRNDAAAAVRAQAAIILGQSANAVKDKKNDRLDPRPVVSDLTENIRVEKEPDVRKEVAIALGFYAEYAKGAIVPLLVLLKDNDVGVRAAAVEAIGLIGAEAQTVLPQLLQLIKDPDQAVRTAAVWALGRLKMEEPTAASAVLVPLVKDPDVELRKAAITSLCLMGDKSAVVVQSVANALKDPDIGIRQRTAQSMSKFGSAVKLVESELTRALKDDADPLVRYHALRTLCGGFGADVKGLSPLLIERFNQEKEIDIRIALVEELGGIATGEGLTKEQSDKVLLALREGQRDPNIKVRNAAVEAYNRALKGPMKPK